MIIKKKVFWPTKLCANLLYMSVWDYDLCFNVFKCKSDFTQQKNQNGGHFCQVENIESTKAQNIESTNALC